MATVFKVLGQVIPAATTLTTLYTAAAPAVVSTIVVCNQATTTATYRISVRVAAAADTTKQYIAYDVSVAGNDSTALTLGITMASTDVISVYSSTATTSFTAFGSEIS